jgi:hypothetical protein
MAFLRDRESEFTSVSDQINCACRYRNGLSPIFSSFRGPQDSGLAEEERNAEPPKNQRSEQGGAGDSIPALSFLAFWLRFRQHLFETQEDSVPGTTCS